MGASSFMTYQAGTDIAEAFEEARLDALTDEGHGGGSGSIAEKGNYVLISGDPVPIEQAEGQAIRLLDDPRVTDQWGPAGAIAVATDRRTVTLNFPEDRSHPTMEAAVEAALNAEGHLNGERTFTIMGSSYTRDHLGQFIPETATVELRSCELAFTGWLFFGFAVQ